MDVAGLHAALIDMIRTWVRTGVHVHPRPYGFLARDPRHPLVYDGNLAWIEGVPEAGVPGLLADLDAAFLTTGVGHRFVLFADPQVAYEHQAAFQGAGFRPHAELVMAKVGLPSCIVNPDLRIEGLGTGAPEADYRAVRLAIHEESNYTPEESRQVYDLERLRAEAVREAAYVGYIGDGPAATYTLWTRGTFALVGNVATLPKYRMQGIGRTMIFDACRRATTAGAEYALLTTDLFDRPQAMYKSLGFEPVGELRGYLRLAP